MTNKPMLSVELRALLERLLSHDFAEECQECGIGYSDAWGELRALLDKEVDMDSYASKHQGDPVAWAHEYGLAGVSVAAKTTWPSFVSASSNRSDCDGVMIPLFRGKPAHAVAMTDDQILEAMRLSITAADGGYVYDMSPEYVIAAGRSLLEVASLLDIKQSPVAVVMLEQLIEAIGVEQDRLFQDAERMTVEDCVKVIRQELDKLNGVNK